MGESADESGGGVASVWTNFTDMMFLHIAIIVPMFSAISYALPEVYISMFLIDQFELSVGVTGIVRAVMLLTPILGIFATMGMPRVSGFMLLLVSIAGYCCLFFLGEGSMIWFIVGNTATVVTGSSPFVQILAKNDFGRDMKKMRNAMSLSNIFYGLGYAIGSYLSGALFQSFGIRGISIAGLSLQIVSFASLCHYLFLANRNRQNMPNDDDLHKATEHTINDAQEASREDPLSSDSSESNKSQDAEISEGKVNDEEIGDPTPTKMGDNHRTSTRIRYKENEPKDGDASSNTKSNELRDISMHPLDDSCSSKQEAATSKNITKGKIKHCVRRRTIDNSIAADFSESDLVQPSKFVKLLPFMFAFEALTVGGFQSIGPIYIANNFGRSESEIGTLIAVSTALGTALSLAIESDTGSDIYSKLFTSPNDLCTLFVIIAISACLLVVPSFAVHALSVGAILVFNEPLQAKMYEVQGAITTARHFRFLGPLSEVLNLSLELAVSLIMPFLYGVYYFVPYTILGVASALFALLFTWTIKRQNRFNTQTLSSKLDDSTYSSSSVNNDTIPRRLSFVDGEILARMVDNL